LTGNYGQEVLRRYIAFGPNSPPERLFTPDFIEYIKNAERTFNETIAGNRLSFALFKQAPWFQYGRLSLEQSQLTQRTPYMDIDLVRLVFQAPREVTEKAGMALRLIAEGNPELAKLKTDRGISARSNNFFTMLGHLYYEFLFKMDYYYSHGMHHWMAKLDHSFAPSKLEELFLGRHKYYHLRVWFRNEWVDFLRNIVLNENAFINQFIDRKVLEDMVSGNTRGDQNYTMPMNSLLTVEMLHRVLIESR
jgi:asparagine synthase (glutamine-hydrolysing)